jgi:protein O-GlcNAc transferase
MFRNDVKATLLAAKEFYQTGQLDQAKIAFEKVLKLDPKQPDSLYCLGLILFQLGDQEEGLRLVKQAVEVRPGQVEVLYDLGIMLQTAGDPIAAAESFRKAVAVNPKYAQAHFALGNALQKSQLLEDAVKSFQQAIVLTPKWAEAHFNLGNALRDLNQPEAALQSYQKALAYKPNWAEAYASIGQSFASLKKYEEALINCKQAIALNANLAEPHFSIGIVLKELKKPVEALISYRMAAILKPDFAEASYDLAFLLFELGRIEEAMPFFRKVIALKPEWAELHNALGLSFTIQGFASMNASHFREADSCFRQALSLRPDIPETYCSLAASPLQTGLSLEECLTLCQKALEIEPDFITAYQNLLFFQQYSEKLTPQLMRNTIEHFAQTCFPNPPTPQHSNMPDPEKRLRIGYLSPDFRYHSCAWFIEPLLSAHNRQEVEIFCYSNVLKADSMTERLKKLADSWHNIRNLDADAVASMIQSHEIDILLDLAGHTSDNFLSVFHYKPAPIQAAWLGYPGSTGLSTIDYRLSDFLLTPTDTPEYFSEKIWNLERPAHCYRPPQAFKLLPLPAEQNGYITFGSFNNLLKVNLETIALWAKALRAVNSSRILIKSRQLSDPEICKKFIQAFRAEGIAENRVELVVSFTGLEAHLNYYNRIDIALDTFPYNGATTTLEALWMGVPVITLAGWRTASRYSLSFLEAVGLRELAANDPEEFAAIAQSLASNLPKLAGLHAELRERMKNSLLCDESNFAQALEDTYRKMWKQWCQEHQG